MSEIGVSKGGFARLWICEKYGICNSPLIVTNWESGWNGENWEEDWGRNFFVESVYWGFGWICK